MVRLFKLLSWLPLRHLRLVGSLMGLAAWLISPKFRWQMRSNVDQANRWAESKGLALPKDLLRVAVARSGWLVSELPAIWCRPSRWQDLSIRGLADFDAAISKGKGVLILTPHLGAFELGPRLFARHHPISIMYRPANYALMESVLRAFRPSSRITMVPANASGIRHFIRTLRAGGVVGLLPDQVPSLGEGVWAPFLGRPAYTMSLPLRLAQMTGTQLAWATVERAENTWTMSLQLWNSGVDLGSLRSEDDWRLAVEAMNRKIEEFIIQSPADYLWAYNRYRNPRPIGTRSSFAEKVGHQ